MIHKKVKFNKTEYWYHHNDGQPCVNISPLDHYSVDGKLLADFDDISWAVVFNGYIMRYGEVIGKESDLVEVK